ncbi:MAG: hypothetical protein KA717_03000 [Woronichinia naegeliana WA131]|jgi:hypothetical protein|uniref:Uncharacterized protein n=1 Tax=Woronichinia naegeliana WA131 TaxID=2824559 RepID=A0A977KXY8_9CYAN|nr:MAG: hypothetical protein KA717_03000 [Woronichinia naegeliana WA131]
MIELLKLLPKSLTTFLYAVAALLRFYGNSDTILFSFFPFTTIEGRFLVFVLGSGSLVANLGLEWHAGNQSRRETTAARTRIENENLAARTRIENENLAAREREARRDNLANEERERGTRHTRIQNRWIILQIQHQLESSPDTRAALRDFLVFLPEYGE